jgi:hypothetical protein
MHHELPSRLDLDFYRKEAKALVRAVRSRERDALVRTAETLGPRAEQRFLLSDAQHVIAFEHGFRSWGEFKRWLETREPEPPVGRIGREPIAVYEHRAQTLVEDVRAGSDDARRRVRAYVPRLAGFEGRQLELRDAKLVVAREYGFPTWRELAAGVERAIAQHVDRPGGDLGHAFELIQAGQVEHLRRLLDEQPDLVHERYPGAATTLLEAVAQPDVFGHNLGQELGLDPRIVELLIERGSELEEPLGLAACFNRVELVRMLLDAGARAVPSKIWGLTPLQTAIYHGSREAGDLLAALALVPDALYVAAGAGRIDDLEKWFEPGGRVAPRGAPTASEPRRRRLAACAAAAGRPARSPRRGLCARSVQRAHRGDCAAPEARSKRRRTGARIDRAPLCNDP